MDRGLKFGVVGVIIDSLRTKLGSVGGFSFLCIIQLQSRQASYSERIKANREGSYVNALAATSDTEWGCQKTCFTSQYTQISS